MLLLLCHDCGGLGGGVSCEVTSVEEEAAMGIVPTPRDGSNPVEDTDAAVDMLTLLFAVSD